MDKDVIIAMQAEQIRGLQEQLRQMTELLEGMQKQLARLLADKEGRRTPSPADGPSPQQPPAPKDRPDKPKRKPRRAKLSDKLERVVEKLDVESCPSCASTHVTELGGPEVSEKLDYVRAHIRVRRIERAKVRCNDCGTFTTAPLPPTAVPGGQMTASLLAWLIYSKCALHLPMDRIRKDLARQGAHLASSTLSDAMGHGASLLQPICDRIVAHLLDGGLVHLDGTGLNVLTPGKKGRYRGQMAAWCNDQVTAYQFTPDKRGEHFAKFLEIGTDRAYQGLLVADAASNMNLLFDRTGIIECGCWYHARDKFSAATESAPIKAAEAMHWIAALFEVERDADEAGDTAAERLSRRRRDARPILDEFEKWLKTNKQKFAPDEDFTKAVNYFENHRDALLRFLSDGRIPLTNNLAERELGVIGRGRKAYLFAGSAAGGERLAVLYTVVRTCERLGIDPFEYLADVLPRLSDQAVNRGKGHLDTLTPMAWPTKNPA